MVEYNRVLLYESIYIPEQIRLHRAMTWNAPIANRGLPITDSLDIELVVAEMAEPSGDEQSSDPIWGTTSHESDWQSAPMRAGRASASFALGRSRGER